MRLHHFQKAAVIAAAFFVSACATLTQAPEELSARLEEALSMCDAPESIALLEEMHFRTLVGPHKCVERRMPVSETPLIFVSADKQSFFDKSPHCSFTLRHVDETIIANTLTRLSERQGWRQTWRIGGLACRGTTCNGRPRCYGTEDWSGVNYIDPSNGIAYMFSWDGLDAKPNILRVFINRDTGLDCNANPETCFPPQHRDTE